MIHTKMNSNQDQVDRLFNVLTPWLHIPVRQVVQPTNNSGFPILANVHTSENAYHIALNVAGYTKEQVKISVENQILTITADKPASEENVKFHLREWKRTQQTRSFTLPKDVDTNAITAAYEEGVLKIDIQKKEKPVAQTIDIK